MPRMRTGEKKQLLFCPILVPLRHFLIALGGRLKAGRVSLTKQPAAVGHLGSLLIKPNTPIQIFCILSNQNKKSLFI